jgi:hypothetical protein
MVSNFQVKSAAITPTYNNKIGFDLVVNLQNPHCSIGAASTHVYHMVD